MISIRPDATGLLYVVGMGLGNLQDISPRALQTLESVDMIYAEDTREIRKLGSLLQLNLAELVSYREQVHDQVLPKIIHALQQGKKLALVSDRGMPTISDPGYRLVRDVQSHGFKVESIPGPSAVTTALAISGLPTDRFIFLGFLPRDPGKQRKVLRSIQDLSVTFIAFESPFRVVKLVQNLQTEFGDIEIALVSELTKMHEKVWRGSCSELLRFLQDKSLKGEWVVLGKLN